MLGKVVWARLLRYAQVCWMVVSSCDLLDRAERERQEKQASDYLAPFLLALEDPEQLTLETAARVREACLKDFSVLLLR